MFLWSMFITPHSEKMGDVMTVSKPIVFISHIAEEKEIAIKIKELIESSLLGAVNVFVSSEQQSISMGSNWLRNVSDALNSCVYTIVLCSPFSIERPWINFETGASWVRGIEIAPLCHSGLTPAHLPPPLNLLQGDLLSSDTVMEKLLGSIAKKIGLSTPKFFDKEEFKDSVTSFEERYTFLDSVAHIFNNIGHERIASLKENRNLIIHIPVEKRQKFEADMSFLASRNILSHTITKADFTFFSPPNIRFQGSEYSLNTLSEFDSTLHKLNK